MLKSFLKPASCLVFIAATAAVHAQAHAESHGIVRSYMDPAIKPGNNFFLYTNGDWMKRTEIPPDRSSVGTFSSLFDLTSDRTAGLIQEAAKSNAPAGSGRRKIADLYHSYMNEAAVEAKGLTPLRPHLEAIAAIHDKTQLAHALGETLRSDVDALNNTNFHTENLFGLWVAGGFNDPDHYAAYLLQGGIALPDREYYLSDSQQMRDLREKYHAHIALLLKLAGFDNTEERATRILALEHAIAEKHQPLAENEDIHKANNTWKQADFAAKAPGFDWPEYFRGANLAGQQDFIIWQPSAFIGEASLVASESLDTWKDWLAFHLIDAYAPYLPKPFADESFAFYGKILSGTPQQRPREQRVVSIVNTYLGDEVGKTYVERYFSPQAKAEAQALVANIIEAFRKRIDALDWMAASTKAEAKAKLSTLYVGVGYPETWQDYSAYDVKGDDLFGNIWRGRLFYYEQRKARLGAAVDRKEWSMDPQTVNAVNLPLQNALNFPAAILQPPFFDPKAPAAANYGAIGATIGHEISHTFDSEGSVFDSKGRIRNWWTDADLAHFNAATAKLAAQYDTYAPFPDLHINGKQTLAENIADVAGLSAAYDAYHASLGGKAVAPQDGFSGDQQFFIAFGQSWQSKMREGVMRQQVLSDGHSLDEYRADTVRNLDPWYTSFDVKPGQKLYLSPAERVRIW